MNDETLRSAYVHVLAARRPRNIDCATPDALLAVAEGSATESERLAVLRHVGRCGTCRADLELLRSARDAALHTRRPVWQRPAFAAAAVIVLLAGSVTVWQATRTPAPDTLRDAAPVTVPLLAPPDDVAATLPVTLVWATVPFVRRYDVEILTTDGNAVFTATTADTVLVVPQDAQLVPGVDYRWLVRAAAPGGALSSPARRLRITTTP